MEANNQPVDEPVAVAVPPTLLDLDNVEERRERRKFKYWGLRVATVVGSVMLLGATGAVIAIAYTRDKELNTDFITELAKVIFDFAKYLYQG